MRWLTLLLACCVSVSAQTVKGIGPATITVNVLSYQTVGSITLTTPSTITAVPQTLLTVTMPKACGVAGRVYKALILPANPNTIGLVPEPYSPDGTATTWTIVGVPWPSITWEWHYMVYCG